MIFVFLSVQSLGWKDPLEEGMVTHSSILAWEYPWTEESGGLQSVGSQRVRHAWAAKHTQHRQWGSGSALLQLLVSSVCLSHAHVQLPKYVCVCVGIYLFHAWLYSLSWGIGPYINRSNEQFPTIFGVFVPTGSKTAIFKKRPEWLLNGHGSLLSS